MQEPAIERQVSVEEEVLTPSDLADHLCVSIRTLRRYINMNLLTTGKRFGHLLRFSKKESIREAREKKLGRYA